MNAAASMPQAETADLLRVENVSVELATRRGTIRPARNVTFTVTAGRTLGVVGESGSGKSVMLRAVMGLLGSTARTTGAVFFGGRDLLGASPAELQQIRGKDMSMIFQDPSASLNPVLTVGDQLIEVIRLKSGLDRTAALSRAVELFERVGIRPARTRLDAYPHQFSGGMAQRVMIAIAIAANPRLLLADEPTTALDVSIQDQVLALLEDLRLDENMGMVIVSHDFGVIARSCDDVAVMYAGYLLERGPVREVLGRPRHPYTRMLLATVPSLTPNVDRTPLQTIEGSLPDPRDGFRGCPFAPRCPFAQPACATIPVELDAPVGGHGSACPFV